MTQDIIVFAIIGITIGYVIFSFIKNLRAKKNSNSCGGCTGCDLSQNNTACSKKIF